MMDEDIGFQDVYFKTCKVCGGTGFHVKDLNSAAPCTCWRMDALLSRIKKAGIPPEYFESSLDKLEKSVSGTMVNNERDEIEDFNVHTYLRRFTISLHKHRAPGYEESGKGVLFYGNTGVGKTMVATIILKHAVWYSVVTRGKYPDYTGHFVTFKEYCDLHFRDKDPEVQEFLSEVRSADFLVLDEVGAEPKKRDATKPADFYRSILDDLLRYRSKFMLPTIVTTNLSRSELQSQYNSGNKQVNRVWDIIEGHYDIIHLKREGGSIRKVQQHKRTKKVIKENPSG